MTDSEWYRELDRDAGHVVFDATGRKQVHLLFPYGAHVGTETESIIGQLRDALQTELGPLSTPTKDTSSERFGAGIYHRELSTQRTSDVELYILEEEIDVGASGVFFQVLVRIAQHVGSSAIDKIIDSVIDRASIEYEDEDDPTGLSHDAILKRVRGWLGRNYGASGEIRFETFDSTGPVATTVAVDERGKRYEVTITTHGSVRSVVMLEP